MKLRTNVKRLVRMGVSAKVDPPVMRASSPLSAGVIRSRFE